MGKFMISMPLLLKKVVFEGTLLTRIYVLKLEDWDLTDHEKFPHLATNKYMTKIYCEETGVTKLELMKWVRGVKLADFYICYVNFHRSIINILCVCQLLALLHDGCLWLGEPIHITNMLIHRIAKFPYKGVDPAK